MRMRGQPIRPCQPERAGQRLARPYWTFSMTLWGLFDPDDGALLYADEDERKIRTAADEFLRIVKMRFEARPLNEAEVEEARAWGVIP